jgi:hypothetical protein
MIFDTYKGVFWKNCLNLWDFEKIVIKIYQISAIGLSWCWFLCKYLHYCELFLWTKWVFWVSFTRCLLLAAVGIKGFFYWTCSTNRLPFIAKSPSWDACYVNSSKKFKKKRKRNPHASLTLSLHSVHPRVVAANSNATTAACLLLYMYLQLSFMGQLGQKLFSHPWISCVSLNNFIFLGLFDSVNLII